MKVPVCNLQSPEPEGGKKSKNFSALNVPADQLEQPSMPLSKHHPVATINFHHFHLTPPFPSLSFFSAALF